MNIPLNIDWQQILLHLLNFAILAGGLYLLLYKPVKAFMEQRQAYYQGIVEQLHSTTKGKSLRIFYPSVQLDFTINLYIKRQLTLLLERPAVRVKESAI